MDEPTTEYEKDGHISLAGGDAEAGGAGYGNVSLSTPSAPPASASPKPADPPLFHGGGSTGGGAPAGGATHQTGPSGVTISTAPVSFDAGSGRASTLSQEMVSEVASQAMRGAGRALRRGASEIRVYVQANPYSITMMSFFGGLWLILASTITLLNLGSLFTNTLAWILQGYQVFFGLIIVIVDGPQDKLPAILREKMMSYVSFMHNNKSRFIFYLFIACQQGSQNNWPSWLTGWYFAAVAAGYALVQLTSSPEAVPSEGINNNSNNNNTMMMEIPALDTESPRDRSGKPLVVGVFGGAFNPIHSGHVLLAVTVLETQPVDEVVIVPVFKHPVKSDLLPFEDRVQMCRLATIGTGVRVSTVEERIGASNDKMLRGIKAEYPPGTKLVWICGDDVFEWIHNPLGQAMLEEVSSMVVQRRLCRAGDSQVAFDESPFNWEAMEEQKSKHGIEISVIDGKMPHVSSSLVRSSPALWRAYLPQLVAFYLDSRPKHLAHLVGRPNPLRRGGGLAPQEPTVAKSGAVPTHSLLGNRANSGSTAARANDLGKINYSCPLPTIYLEEPEFEMD